MRDLKSFTGLPEILGSCPRVALPHRASRTERHHGVGLALVRLMVIWEKLLATDEAPSQELTRSVAPLSPISRVVLAFLLILNLKRSLLE